MILLERTCEACPEQYDVYYNGINICYIRLRWGKLTAYIDQTIIYSYNFPHHLTGSFIDPPERMYHLLLIVEELIKHGYINMSNLW